MSYVHRYTGKKIDNPVVPYFCRWLGLIFFRMTMKGKRGSGKNRIKTVVSGKEHLRSVYSLAIDWVHDHLYWSDYAMRKISVSFGNGSWPATIVSFRGVSPHSIAIHPGRG